MVLNNQICLKLLKKFGPLVNVNLLKVFLKTSGHDLKKQTIVEDDVMNEVSSNATISKLFTRGRSHLGCSLVLMLQNIFLALMSADIARNL